MLCGACWRRVQFIRAPLCDVTGIPLPYDTGERVVSALALAHPPAYDRARAVAHFNGSMRTLVHHFKYADRHDARQLFGQWLAESGRDLLPGIDVIVPVPMTRLRLLLRRFNQSAVLAHELGRQTGIPVDPHLLVRARSTSRQVGLTRDQRRRNVAGAFRVAAGRLSRAQWPPYPAHRRRDHHRRHGKRLRPRPETGRRPTRRRAGARPRHGCGLIRGVNPPLRAGPARTRRQPAEALH